jgi:hypothetical protein
MFTNVKTNRCPSQELVVSLLFVVVLFSSLFVFVFSSNVSPFVAGAPYTVEVSNEAELVDAVDNATGPVIIALNRDIRLTCSLVIPADKDITLTSNANGFCSLIGPNVQSTIYVSARGILTLDGIVVNHETDATGSGVTVSSRGTFIMNDGRISHNVVTSYHGGGVLNEGTFVMSGGRISHNAATSYDGGGVYNRGTFTMSGGEIYGNTAKSGGGVFNMGNFIMSGGRISENGVYGRSNSKNVDGFGGGVSNSWDCTFELRGGKVSGNRASNGGNNVYNVDDVYYFGVSAVAICVGIVVVIVGVVVILFLLDKKRGSKMGKQEKSETTSVPSQSCL